MRSLASRLQRLEETLAAANCTCAEQPVIAVTFENPDDWTNGRNAGPLVREQEEAKLAFTCPTHGLIGAGVHARILSFSTVIDGRAVGAL